MARKQPYNLDAEMEVLGAAFIDNDVLDKICVELSGEMFYDEKNHYLFDAIKTLYEKNVPVDVLTVTDELERSKTINIVGVEYLADVVDSVASTANLDYYMNIVYEKALLRKLIDSSNKIINVAYEENEDAGSIVDYAEREMFEVTKNRKAGEFQPITDVIRRVQARIEANAKVNQEVTGIATGFYDFDKMTSGLHENELIILAARPGMGKTALGLNVASYVATHQDKAVAFFSLEMGAEQLVMRLLSSIGRIDMGKLKTGRLDHQDWKRVNEAMSELADANLFIEDASDIKVSEIRAKCRRLANSPQGLSLVIIDYLSLIQGTARYAGNRQQEVSEVSRSLKIMAKELGIPVIALAQLSRNTEGREDKKPMLSDLRESGSIEQDADIVAFLYSDDYYNREERAKSDVSLMQLIIGKHRNGAQGEINLVFERNLSNFKNYANTDMEKE